MCVIVFMLTRIWLLDGRMAILERVEDVIKNHNDIPGFDKYM